MRKIKAIAEAFKGALMGYALGIVLLLNPIYSVSVPVLAQETINQYSYSVPLIISGTGNILSFGSGFVVGNDLIMTAGHVVDTPPVHVRFANGWQGPKTSDICHQAENDLAVVRTKLPITAGQLVLSQRPLYIGTEVWLVGWPKGQFRDIPGQIIDFETKVIVEFPGEADKAVGPMAIVKIANAQDIGGMSGGPVMNKEGEVVGVVVSNDLLTAEVGFTPVAVLKECKF